MSEAILNSVIEKLDSQEIRINAQHKLLQSIGDKAMEATIGAKEIPQVLRLLEKLEVQIRNLQLPESKMVEMKNILEQNFSLLRNPAKQKVQHIHSASRIIWIAAVLFCLIVFIGVGWYSTHLKLQEYKSQDIMWRYIKLNTSSNNLKYLQNVESEYQKNPEEMSQWVTEQELKLTQQAEAMQKAMDAEEKAKTWRKVAGESVNKKAKSNGKKEVK